MRDKVVHRYLPFSNSGEAFSPTFTAQLGSTGPEITCICANEGYGTRFAARDRFDVHDRLIQRTDEVGIVETVLNITRPAQGR